MIVGADGRKPSLARHCELGPLVIERGKDVYDYD